MQTLSVAHIFNKYDLRGLYPQELNEELAYRIGRCFVPHLQAKKIVLGRDMREGSESLLAAVSSGALDAGADVTDIGMVSTDALYFSVAKYDYDGGIMITASHNPVGYNGMKFTGSQARALSLASGLSTIRDQVCSGNLPAKAKVKGKLSTKSVLNDFAAHCLKFIDLRKIRPLKLAVDAGNGMAGRTVPAVFKHLPCQVIPIYFELDGRFPNHPASPLEPENMRDLQAAVLAHGCDLGAAFDGDADRMFIVDEKANLVSGDTVTSLVAMNVLKRHPGAKILYNLICSASVRETIEKYGGVARRSPVGHSLIKQIMREEDIVFGGEHSGHFYFKDNWFADSGMIALLQCLEVFSESSRPPSEIIAPLITRHRSGEINCSVSDVNAKLKEIESCYKDASIDFLDGLTIERPDYWLNVRASNTEPLLRLNVEGATRELMEEHRNRVLKLIGAEI
jgi:phosphomannomutase